MMRVAIAGCGWVAGMQVETGFAQLPDLFEIVACCDLDEARMHAFAERYGIATRCRRYADLLALPGLDAISICTPPSEHHAMVRVAMAAGKHVLCEKPFTASISLMDDVIAAQAGSQARVMPIFQYRYGTGFAKAQALLRSGLAGRLFVSSVETAWLRGPDYYGVPWRGRFATELGGVLVTQSIHIQDLFLCLAGPVSQVAAFKATRVNPIEVEDCAVASLHMADGSLASLTATLGSALPTTRLRLCYENLVIERECSGPDAPMPALEPWRFLARDPKLQPEIDAEIAGIECADRFFAGQFRAFHSALADGRPFDVTLDDARRALELITAIYTAAETGRTQSLPISIDHPRYKGWSGTAPVG
jgi:predicted dehydrogenase